MHLDKDQQHLLLFIAGVALALVGLYLLARRSGNPAAVIAPAAATASTATSAPTQPTANYDVTLNSYNSPGASAPVSNAPAPPPFPALPQLVPAGSGSAFPIQDNLAIVPQFPWG